jgi:GAF domain-containing protein
MSDDRLRDSLEGLFSDFSSPGSEGDLEIPPPLPTSVEEPPSELKEEPPSPVVPPATPQVSRAVIPDEARQDVGKEEEAAQEITYFVEDLQTWREELVQRMLRALVIVGLPVLAAGSYNAYAHGDLRLVPFYLGAYAVLALITFSQRVSYTLQAVTLTGLVYGMGVLDFAEDGIGGSGRIFLVLLPFIAVLFFGVRGGALALAVALLTMGGYGWAFTTGRIVIPVQKQVTSANPIVWLSGTLVLLMMATLPVLSLSYLLPRFTATLARSRRLAQELGTQQARLEEQVAERTHALQEANYALQRRAIQLQTSAEVARTIISIFDVDNLLRKAVGLIRDQFGFYHAGIFLLDETGEWAILREATGEAGAKMKAQGHRLAVGDTSMVGWTALHHQPRVALDVGEDAIRFANPLLPYTRSEMTLPMMVGDRLLGVLNVQSTEEAAFDEDDVQVLQSMANQVAVAIENARRVSDDAALLETTSPIYRVSHRLTTATTTNEVADTIIASVAETGADGCLVVELEFSPNGEPEALLYRGVWRRDREPQFQPGTRLPITESPFPLEMVNTLWTVADVEQDGRLPQSARQVLITTGVRALANVPLRARGKVIGQVVVLRVTPGPFSNAALRLYEVLSGQAAVALERAQLLERAQRRAEQEQLTRQTIDHIRRTVDIEQALQTTAEELSQAMGVPYVSIELSLEAAKHE